MKLAACKARLRRGEQLGLLEVDTACKQIEGDKPEEPKGFDVKKKKKKAKKTQEKRTR